MWFLHGGAERAGQQGVRQLNTMRCNVALEGDRSRKNRSGRTGVYIGWWIGILEREGAGGRERERVLPLVLVAWRMCCEC